MLPAASADTGENNKERMFVWLGLLLNKLSKDSGFSLQSTILPFYSFLMKPFLPEREENCLFPKCGHFHEKIMSKFSLHS